MDSILEEPSSPTLLLGEVAEIEGLMRIPSYHANDWGPMHYNRHHHPLHIMVNMLHAIWILIYSGTCTVADLEI